MSFLWQPGLTLEDVEKEVIKRAFQFYGQKLTTAGALGISVRTLDTKLAKYAAEDSGGNSVGGVAGEKAAEESLRSEARIGVEQSAPVSEKPSVPLRERKEIQKMSSR